MLSKINPEIIAIVSAIIPFGIKFFLKLIFKKRIAAVFIDDPLPLEHLNAFTYYNAKNCSSITGRIKSYFKHVIYVNPESCKGSTIIIDTNFHCPNACIKCSKKPLRFLNFAEIFE